MKFDNLNQNSSLNDLMYHYALIKHLQTKSRRMIEQYLTLDKLAKKYHQFLLEKLNTDELDYKIVLKIERLINEFGREDF